MRRPARHPLGAQPDPCRVRVEVEVEVEDTSSDMPVLGRSCLGGYRGLIMVDKLPQDWGVRPTADGGKAVGGDLL